MYGSSSDHLPFLLKINDIPLHEMTKALDQGEVGGCFTYSYLNERNWGQYGERAWGQREKR